MRRLGVLIVLVLGLAGPAAAAPPGNDGFVAAESLLGGSGTTTGSTREATKEPAEPSHAGNAGGRSVWYAWTAPASGTVTIETTGSSFDTLLAVYTGAAVGSLAQVTANDDISSSVLQSRVTFTAAAGTTYRIAVDGYRSSSSGAIASGSVTLGWSQAATLPPPTGAPANDAFTASAALTGATGTLSGTTTGATKEPGEPSHAGNAGGRSVWYAWTAPASGPATIETTGSSFDTLLAVYTGSAVGSLTQVAANDDISSSVLQSRVTFTAAAGTTYRIAVDGYRSSSSGAIASGSVSLAWTATAPAPPSGPPNDAFASAQALAGVSGSVTGATRDATKEAGEPSHAGNAGGRSVWYAWTAPGTGVATIETVGSNFDTLLAVYTGAATGSLSQVAANDDISGTVYQSRVSFTAAAGTTYRIAVDGYRSSSGNVAYGDVVLAWSQSSASGAPNDLFADAALLTGASGTVQGSTSGATRESGEPPHAGSPGGASVWFRYTAPTGGILRVDTIGSGFDTLLAAYEGTAIGGLRSLSSDDDSGGNRTSRLLVGIRAGETLRIALDGKSGAAGAYTLSWEFLATVVPPPPTGDPVLLAAGDIGQCSSSGDENVSLLFDRIGGTIQLLGDNVYSTDANAFSACYGRSWGRHADRIRPAAGNHDYDVAPSGGAGYFNYFGAAAGERGKGWYSYELGTWHVVVLNTNGPDDCVVLSCAAGSEQEQWLRADLAASNATCTLAVTHSPRFSSGEHGSSATLVPLWEALYAAGADVVLSGHDHDYERFAPQTPAGVADPAFGVRQFVAGTGGAYVYGLGPRRPNSEAASMAGHGLLQLTLHPGGYDWEFVPVPGVGFRDSGSGSCHDAPPPP